MLKSNPWDIYSSHPLFDSANIALDEGWKIAKKFELVSDAEQYMDRIMERYSEVGAYDTEPRAILREKLGKLAQIRKLEKEI